MHYIIHAIMEKEANSLYPKFKQMYGMGTLFLVPETPLCYSREMAKLGLKIADCLDNIEI
jgi:hypothetical protein